MTRYWVVEEVMSLVSYLGPQEQQFFLLKKGYRNLFLIHSLIKYRYSSVGKIYIRRTHNFAIF